MPWRRLLPPESLTGWQSKYIIPQMGRDMLSISYAASLNYNCVNRPLSLIKTGHALDQPHRLAVRMDSGRRLGAGPGEIVPFQPGHTGGVPRYSKGVNAII